MRFHRDVFKDEYLRKLGLNERQIAAVVYVRQHASITNADHRALAGVQRKTAARDLDGLVSLGVLERTGERKGTRYVLRKNRGTGSQPRRKTDMGHL